MAGNQDEILVKSELIEMNAKLKTALKDFELGLKEAKSIKTSLESEKASGMAWLSLLSTVEITSIFQDDLLVAAKELSTAMNCLETEYNSFKKHFLYSDLEDI